MWHLVCLDGLTEAKVQFDKSRILVDTTRLVIASREIEVLLHGVSVMVGIKIVLDSNVCNIVWCVLMITILLGIRIVLNLYMTYFSGNVLSYTYPHCLEHSTSIICQTVKKIWRVCWLSYNVYSSFKQTKSTKKEVQDLVKNSSKLQRLSSTDTFWL